MLTTNEIGAAGEHRVIAELLLRGHRPLVAVVDEGADLLLAEGTSVQVKATATRTRNKRAPDQTYFEFRFHSKVWRNGRAIMQRGLSADVAICWAIPEDRFWIIPADAIGVRNAVVVPSATAGRASMWARYEDRWDLLRAPESIEAPRQAQEV
jgi:hypothetical protein